MSRESPVMAYYSTEEPRYRYGAVVRSFFPQRNALLILEPAVGVYYAQFQSNPKRLFSVGMTLRFILNKKPSGFCYLTDVAFEQEPAPWASEDVLFVHHFCELCQRFVFSPDDATGAFFLLTSLSQPLIEAEDPELKKLSILKDFFLMLGHYATVDDTKTEGFSLGYDWGLGVSRKQKNDIKQWLRACICACEPGYALKTIHFLTTEQGAVRL